MQFALYWRCFELLTFREHLNPPPVFLITSGLSLFDCLFRHSLTFICYIRFAKLVTRTLHYNFTISWFCFYIYSQIEDLSYCLSALLYLRKNSHIETLNYEIISVYYAFKIKSRTKTLHNSDSTLLSLKTESH